MAVNFVFPVLLTLALASDYDRKTAIVNGGVKRFRCIEEWIPVDAFGNIVPEGAVETRSTSPHLTNAENSASALVEYVRTQSRHMEHTDNIGGDLIRSEHLALGAKTRKTAEDLPKLGPWERELLATLEESPVRHTSPAAPRKTTLKPVEIDLAPTLPPTTSTTTTTISSTSKKPITSPSPQLSHTPVSSRTTTFLAPMRRNRVRLGGVNIHSKQKIHSQKKHRPPSKYEDNLNPEEDLESEYNPRMTFYRNRFHGGGIRPPPPMRRRYGMRFPPREYDDYYDDYDEIMPRRRLREGFRNDWRFSRERMIREPLRGYGQNRRQQYMPSLAPLPPALPPALNAFTAPPSLRRNVLPPTLLPASTQNNLLQPTTLAPLRRRHIRPHSTSLSIQPISSLKSTTPIPLTTASLLTSTGRPAQSGGFEDANPENCAKMKQLGATWGITDLVSFASSNCGFLQSFAPGATCDQITHFIASCDRSKFL